MDAPVSAIAGVPECVAVPNVPALIVEVVVCEGDGEFDVVSVDIIVGVRSLVINPLCDGPEDVLMLDVDETEADDVSVADPVDVIVGTPDGKLDGDEEKDAVTFLGSNGS